MLTASNHWFDDERDAALADRITLLLETQDIRDPDNFKEMIRRANERRASEYQGDDPNRPTVTLEEFAGAMAQVRQVRPSPEYLDKLTDLRRKAKAEGLIISPRRWVELDHACSVPAWLSGRDVKLPDDLVVCEHGMWREVKDRPIAAGLVTEFQGRFVRMANEMRGEAAEPLARLEAVRPKVEATPPNVDIDAPVLREAVNVSRAVDACRSRVVAGLTEAANEQRDAPDLRELADELLAAQKWFKANGIPTKLAEPGF
jgi:AAA lid domain